MMSGVIKALIVIGALALIIIIGFIDFVTGLLPDLTILYLIPIVFVTAFAGMRYGLFVAIAAGIAELTANILFGVDLGIILFFDATLHILVFLLGVFATDRLITQLRAITELEQKRTHDLEIAREIQRSVFTPFPPEYKDLTIGSRITFARELGGDYYHFADFNGKLFFCIADISGKGMAASLFSVLLHESIIDALKHSNSLAGIVSRVNTRMHASLPDNMFITLFCCFINSETISFINAGHEPPLLYSRQYDTVKLLESPTTLPVGIRPDLEIGVISEIFASGDILLAVTDGVTESAAFSEDPFEKLEVLLRGAKDQTPKDIAGIVFNRAIPAGQGFPADDIIVTCIKRQS